jgi:hypothetical protein
MSITILEAKNEMITGWSSYELVLFTPMSYVREDWIQKNIAVSLLE